MSNRPPPCACGHLQNAHGTEYHERLLSPVTVVGLKKHRENIISDARKALAFIADREYHVPYGLPPNTSTLEVRRYRKGHDQGEDDCGKIWEC